MVLTHVMFVILPLTVDLKPICKTLLPTNCHSLLSMAPLPPSNDPQ